MRDFTAAKAAEINHGAIIASDQLLEPVISVKSLPGISSEGAVHSPEGDRKYNAKCIFRYDVT